MYYIYAYIDPRNNLPFYIGKGKDGRKFSHLKETINKTDNRDKLKIIQELQSLCLSPLIKELESNIESELMAYNREDYYILKYGRKGIEPYGILTNKIIGGKTPPTPVWTEEKKKEHSNFNKTYWTVERRRQHGLKTKGNNGGKVSIGTVNVTDLNGASYRIPKSIYDTMDRCRDITAWEYVSVTSKESKRRKRTPLGP
jgi:hypothetical protein